jgi:tryptophanyl-tRNA synthetase
MAADILLYDAELVPVEGKTNYNEITRDVASRFNHQIGLKLPVIQAKIGGQHADSRNQWRKNE